MRHEGALRTDRRCLQRLIPRQRPQLGNKSTSLQRTTASVQHWARAKTTADALLSHPSHDQPP